MIKIKIIFILFVLVLTLSLLLFSSPLENLAVFDTTPTADAANGITVTDTLVLGYNDLGMHCMNRDFSEIIILPPANTMHATVINRKGEEPKIVTKGVSISYRIPNNNRSSNKTNFWQYAQALLGKPLTKGVGITGNRLTGNMTPASGRSDWVATAIPLTPITDSGREDPYQLAALTVTRSGKVVARTQAVMPVSWEMNCNFCHKQSGSTSDTHILRVHDRRHKTSLEKNKPVVCGKCHAQLPLNLKGQQGLPSLSKAMHSSHASRMKPILTKVKGLECYACHPGIKTKCERDIHATKGMTCKNCHGDMARVAAKSRPWRDEPKCSNCHHRAGFQYEEPGKLFRESKGHNGIMCAACHGSPHAIYPTTKANDNYQVIALQGHAGTINTCAVCHNQQPDDPFNHSIDD